MNKVTFLILLINVSMFAQINNYQDYTNSRPPISQDENTSTSITRLNSVQRVIVSSFTDITEFQTAVTTDCSESNSIIEDFDGSPASDVVLCSTISSTETTNSCFPSGELQDGFEISASNDGVIAAAAQTILTIPLVGANQPAEKSEFLERVVL